MVRGSAGLLGGLERVLERGEERKAIERDWSAASIYSQIAISAKMARCAKMACQNGTDEEIGARAVTIGNTRPHDGRH